MSVVKQVKQVAYIGMLFVALGAISLLGVVPEEEETLENM